MSDNSRRTIAHRPKVLTTQQKIDTVLLVCRQQHEYSKVFKNDEEGYTDALTALYEKYFTSDDSGDWRYIRKLIPVAKDELEKAIILIGHVPLCLSRLVQKVEEYGDQAPIPHNPVDRDAIEGMLLHKFYKHNEMFKDGVSVPEITALASQIADVLMIVLTPPAEVEVKDEEDNEVDETIDLLKSVCEEIRTSTHLAAEEKLERMDKYKSAIAVLEDLNNDMKHGF